MTAEQGLCSSYKNLMDIDSDVTPMLVSTDVTGSLELDASPFCSWF
jgi:hypothetical protein